jgi:hypothetical protein
MEQRIPFLWALFRLAHGGALGRADALIESHDLELRYNISPDEFDLGSD